MSMLEDIIVKAKSAMGMVGEKAGNFVDVSKLNISIAEEKGLLKKKFECLGKFVYDLQKNGTLDNVSVENYVNEIENIQNNIKRMEQEVSMLKNQIMCGTCGHKNHSDARYCSKCGKELAVKCEVIGKHDCNCDCDE